MATDFRVVTPDDLGVTIKLGIKESDKYDIDPNQLNLPPTLTALELQGTTLTAKTSAGDKAVDLAPLVPNITAEIFLKSVVKKGTNLVFTVGEKDNTNSDTLITVAISDLLDLNVGNGLTGDATTSSPLAVKAKSDGFITVSADGIAVNAAQLAQDPAFNKPADSRDVRLVNATGTNIIGYIYATEQ